MRSIGAGSFEQLAYEAKFAANTGHLL